MAETLLASGITTGAGEVQSDKKDEPSEHSYRVTDRGLEEYKFLLENHFPIIESDHVILNIGGGVTQKFEADLMEEHPGIVVHTIDPSVNTGFTKQNPDKSFSSVPSGSVDIKRRVRSLPNSKRTYSDRANNMSHLKDESIDFAFDVHGPAQYITKEAELTAYLKEVERILKPGGKILISTFSHGDILDGESKEDFLKNIQNGVKKYDSLVSKLINGSSTLSHKIIVTYEPHIRKAPWSDMIPDVRIGAELTKI
jgi:SAM-dependent methyltransferase